MRCALCNARLPHRGFEGSIRHPANLGDDGAEIGAVLSEIRDTDSVSGDIHDGNLDPEEAAIRCLRELRKAFDRWRGCRD